MPRAVALVLGSVVVAGCGASVHPVDGGALVDARGDDAVLDAEPDAPPPGIDAMDVPGEGTPCRSATDCAPDLVCEFSAPGCDAMGRCTTPDPCAYGQDHSTLACGCDGTTLNNCGAFYYAPWAHLGACEEPGLDASDAPDDAGCDGANLESDPTNCGACGHVCEPGRLCIGGGCVCECPMGQITCGDVCCVNAQTDVHNCGACGNACAPAQSCVAGRCADTTADAG